MAKGETTRKTKRSLALFVAFIFIGFQSASSTYRFYLSQNDIQVLVDDLLARRLGGRASEAIVYRLDGDRLTPIWNSNPAKKNVEIFQDENPRLFKQLGLVNCPDYVLGALTGIFCPILHEGNLVGALLVLYTPKNLPPLNSDHLRDPEAGVIYRTGDAIEIE